MASFNNKNFARNLEKHVVKALVQHTRNQLESLRHPASGEFPTVYADGDTLASLQMRLEGGPQALEHAVHRVAMKDDTLTNGQSSGSHPKVFLSYASDDTSLAERIARAFMNAGIDTWWAEWSMAAGDSLRQRIDDGLGDCTHFVVLLTPHSISRPWVNQEMDAGLVRKLSSKSRFIPLRHGLSPSELPPLLSGMVSPEVDGDAVNLEQLINDILGVARKPPLESLPKVVTSPLASGYSPGANAVAEVFVKSSVNGTAMDPQLAFKDLSVSTGLSLEDVADACFELSSAVKVHGRSDVWPENSLFAEFDKHWMEWNPEVDALKLASDLVNEPNFPTRSSDIAARYAWTPRRLNPAITFLAKRGLIITSEAIGCRPYVTTSVRKTDSTRRFVKSRM